MEYFPTETTNPKQRKNRTVQEQIDYRLEQAEIAAEKAAKKAEMKLAKARALIISSIC